jgi:HK97 family phage major capsid protein
VTAVMPETGDELEELFHDPARLSAAVEDGGVVGLVRNYAEKWAASKYGPEMQAQVQEQAQLGLQEFFQDQAERNGALPREGFRPGMALDLVQGRRSPRRQRAVARSKMRNASELFDRQGLFAERALGAADDIDNSEYSSDLKNFVWATIKGEHVAKRDGNGELLDKLQGLKGSLAKTLEIRNAGMSERVPSEGGFLVPETLRSEILALSLEDGVMRKEATVIPMDSLRVPLPSIDDTSHTASVFGGVAAEWTAEGAALTITAPKFGRVVLQASKLTAFTQIPNELLQDSVSPMDIWFQTFFPQAVSFFEDYAFLMGSGIDEPEGLLNCPGAVIVTPGTSYEIALTDVIAMLCRLWPPSLKRARWVCSPDALQQLLGMGLVVSGTAIAPPAMLGGYQAIQAPGGSEGDGFNYHMLGLPLRVSEKVPYPGSGQPNGALALYDPTGYIIGDRQAMQVASSAEYSFANDEVSYRITQRLDGRGWQRSALTPANGSTNKLSMTVILAQAS